MTKHLSHEEKLAFVFGLEAGDERTALERHLNTCAACREEVERLEARDRQLAAAASPEPGPRENLLVRAWRSRTLPLAVFLASVLLGAAPAAEQMQLAPLAIVLGSAVVAVWLHSLLKRAEVRWQETRAHLEEALPDGPADRAFFLEGVRFSVAADLSGLRAKLGTVVLISLTVVSLGVIALIAGLFLDPETAASTMVDYPKLLSLAAAMILLIGSSMWCGLRLKKLALQLLEILEAETRRLASRGV